ncbi:SET domain-containing protein [Rhodopirellula europaea]|uniref:Protein containing SET domain protein n=1 Tax=Rhodopirellula europaea 6C TaxID=1263867 RepID=M2ANK4_9BACT|nr:SET domain-containing protein-lysine N-methyltransferase [Rhodopirellula europaea]EMB14307.1 protein containing SET domain protein [Rhodopirellula europaea 6C]
MTALDKQRRKKLQAVVDKDYSYRSYYDDDIEVKSTGRCGFGVYAARQFQPGELVFEVTGQLINKKHYEGSEYVMDLDEDWYLEPSTPGAFMNHSCSPNCELVQLTEFSLGVVAICNIEAETEISFDYAWEAFDWNPKCQCGARNCRGWVVSQDEVKKMKRLAKGRKKKPR